MSDNGFIKWTNAAILWIGPLGNKWNLNQNATFPGIEFKHAVYAWRPFCFNLRVLRATPEDFRVNALGCPWSLAYTCHMTFSIPLTINYSGIKNTNEPEGEQSRQNYRRGSSGTWASSLDIYSYITVTALPRKLSQDYCQPPVNSFRGRAFYNLSLTAYWNFYTGWLHKIMIQSTTWWRHQMETFSALLAICAGNSPAPGEFPAQRPVTRSFDVFFDLHLNKRLRKQSWGWWFEMLHYAHYDVTVMTILATVVPWHILPIHTESSGHNTILQLWRLTYR